MASSSSKTPLDPNYETHLFWNTENTPVPLDRMPDLIDNIESSLQTLDSRYYLSRKYAVGDIDLPFIREHRALLEAKNVTVVDAPPNERRKARPHQRPNGLAKRIIVEKMEELVLTATTTPKNILIISDDSDFGLIVNVLKKYGCNAFLAVNGDQANDTYTRTADHVWEWRDMQKGGAFCKRSSDFLIIHKPIYSRLFLLAYILGYIVLLDYVLGSFL